MIVPPLLAVCGGFLLAVLWFDLMFDVQVLGQPPGDLPEQVLASIATYYHRVTTGADPMQYLVGFVMLVTLLGTLRQLRLSAVPFAVRCLSFLASALPIASAIGRIVPNAVRLGSRVDPIAVQSALARSICREHVACFLGILLFSVLQVYVVRRLSPTGARMRTPWAA